MQVKLSCSKNRVIFRLFAAGLVLGRDFRFLFFFFFLKKLGIFGSNLGTKVYAFAYNEGRLEKCSNFHRGPLSFLVSCFCLGFCLDQ